MSDRESVIKGLEPIIGCAKQEKWGAWIDTLEDALDLLKDQEDLGKELENAIELIHKKNARIEILKTVLNEQPEIVRCKNCRFYNSQPDSNGDRCDKIHWSRSEDWFCADGKGR